MKNLSLISLVLNGILLIAVIILFYLVLGKDSNKPANMVMKAGNSTLSGTLPIAYVNVDSLLLNYTFAKNANETLIKKQEDSRLTLNSRARQLQIEMSEFQRKLENNAFLSRERAEAEQSRLMKKQQDLQQMEGAMSQQLMEQQQKMSEQLRDTINAFMKDFNKDNRYQMIISNTANDNVLYAGKSYDITSEVIAKLNERFGKKK